VLFLLLFPLHRFAHLSWLRVVRYPSTRIIAATLTAMLFGLFLGPWFIGRLKDRQIGQQVRDDGPQTHKKKAGTPTMGGSLIIFSLVTATLLWCDLRSPFVWLVTGVTVGYGVIGFLDDYLKISKKNSKGLPGRLKLAGQLVIGGAALAYLFYSNSLAALYRDHLGNETRFWLALPFGDFSHVHLVLPAWLYVIFGACVVVGASNAVNLTDGLDGLAIGPVIFCSGAFLLLAYAAGTVITTIENHQTLTIADYLHIPYVGGAEELAVYCGAMAGAGVGFLWFNTYPASVFMGDVGSLALGGGLGMLAVLTKNELLLVIMGGMFVLEAVSVIVQVISFRYTGKRVFRMAPIHHHFELKGWAEPKVIVRFWILSFLLVLLALGTLKAR
jgi:phospho-N-acetylmuramoyl-pentapeptide-transferase